MDEDAEPAPKKKGRLSFDDEQQGGIVRGAGLGIGTTYPSKDADMKGAEEDYLPILPEEWKLLVSEDKKAHFNILQKLLRSKDFDYVVNACDAG